MFPRLYEVAVAGIYQCALRKLDSEAVSGTSWLRLVAFLFGNGIKCHGHRKLSCGPGCNAESVSPFGRLIQ